MSNELATTNNTINTVLAQDTGTTFCSITPDGDRAKAAAIFAAMNNPENRVADFINQSIEVSNVLIEAADLADMNTGEINRVPRVVLISPTGESYQAYSIGMFNAVRNAYQCFGAAPWEPALTFDIKQKPTQNGSMLTAIVH